MQSKPLSTILVAFAVVFGMSYAIASRQGAVSTPDGSDWLYVDHDLAGTRYSPLKQITTKNVTKLVKVCAYSFPDKEPSQTAPIVSASILYLTTAHYTIALDGYDCRVIWTNKWSPRDYETMNTQRGAALSAGKIIRGTADGFLLARQKAPRQFFAIAGSLPATIHSLLFRYWTAQGQPSCACCKDVVKSARDNRKRCPPAGSTA